MPLLEREVLEQFSYFCEIICMTLVLGIKALFIWLIIRLIQLVFLAGTIFFSHKKSANSVFQPTYNSSRTAPKIML
jgi:hypothetical protein